MAFERLFEDPMAAFGYGLLTSRDNPIGTGFDTLLNAQEAQRRRENSEFDKKIKLAELSAAMQKAQQPDLQFNPVTGEMVDMRTGTPYSGGAMPSSGGAMAGDGIAMPSGMNPLEQKIFREQQIKSRFEQEAEARKAKQKEIDDKRESEQKIENERRKAELAKREELGAMTSKMPELEKNITEMGSLAKKATYSPVGRGIDSLANFFGTSTAGQDALVDYTSRIDNQVLPLLKETFGAAFTVTEGDNLKATLGRPDMTPTQKQIVLNNFINQKKANVIAKQRELGIAPQQHDKTAARIAEIEKMLAEDE